MIKRRASEPLITEIVLCDTDDSELCVVTFGADHLDHMVINFQLPEDEYPLFYVKATNRGIVNVYSCEVSEDILTSVDCTGIRTPLGESVQLEVYTTEGDMLLGRGEFIVSALLLSTPVNLTELPTDSPTDEVEAIPSPEEILTDIPTEAESTPTVEEIPSDEPSETISPTP